ncbi:methylcrotonoyl-CoA carboxylase beta chain, mitochondrial-like [Clytia hemisphaerica]|uniref:methylcrotonoyl-CoA carboxylase n=1 Tax=Clytia hemisphaerica TaxID=252671 RepID=A0A7M5XBF0_9CNID
MLALLRRHSNFTKFGCRTIRRFRVLDGNLSLDQSERDRLADEAQKSEELYQEKLAQIMAGSSASAVARHTQKNKKLLARDRIKLLVDQDYPVLELSALAGLDMEYGDVLSAGIVGCIAKVSGQLCVINANDATVKGGTIYPISLKKQLRLQEICEQNNLPAVYLIDSGGAFLPLQSEIFVEGGRSFYNEAIMNSKGIPQLCMVAGSCTAGAAYIPTMANEVVMVDKIGTIFLAGPPLVHAAIGQQITEEALGGATVHCEVSGCADYKAKDEIDAIDTMKDVLSTLNLPEFLPKLSFVEDPFFNEEDLSILSVKRDADGKLDTKKIVARIVDGSRFHEYKPTYGREIICGFARLGSMLVGVVANDGRFTPQSCLKASNFVCLCDERGIPLVFLQDILKVENAETAIELIKYQAELMSYVATTQVPKITIIMGNSFGVGNYAMCGRSMSPRFLFSWPTARVSIHSVDDMKQTINNDEKHLQRLEREVTSVYGSSRIWDDGIVLPKDTRQALIQSLTASMMHKETKKSSNKNVVRL